MEIICGFATSDFPWTATGREHFACQASGVSQIFVQIISNVEKVLSNINVVV